MIAYAVSTRPSRHVRPELPEGMGTPHPRAVELADAMLDIAALGHGVSFKDLISAGFTAAEIVEFNREADRLATARRERQLTIRPDLAADIKLKLREAHCGHLPLPRDTEETQPLVILWGSYCAARAAYRLDPTEAQRQRCLDLANAYLAKMPAIYPSIRTGILADLAAHLPKVSAR